jgi:uncharacterized protein (TIGR03435 family)
VRRLLFAVVAALVGGVAVTAQAQLPGAVTAVLPTFDAASVKSPDPKTPPILDLRFYPNRFVAMRMTLSHLIEQAYDILPREVVGGPDWVRVEQFDVIATTANDVSLARMKLMLQALLADRFQLQLERETTTGTVYRLTAPSPRNINPPAKPDERPIIFTVREDGKGALGYSYDGHNATMAAFVLILSQHVKAPVADETKLAGNYDFRVNWTYDDAVGGLEPDPNVPTIFTALERDLGLKLVADKGPVPVHVIRRVSKPSAN